LQNTPFLNLKFLPFFKVLHLEGFSEVTLIINTANAHNTFAMANQRTMHEIEASSFDTFDRGMHSNAWHVVPLVGMVAF